MKFSSILYAAFGLSTFVAALPAPAPAPVSDTGLELVKKLDLVERDPVAALTERNGTPDLVADVQLCIDAVVAINKNYAGQKPYTSGLIKAWALEIVVKIKLLIAVISAYPEDCVYPAINICVSIFVKLFVAIFVQLKVFIDVGGLIGALLLTVDLLLAILLGLVADLLNICVSLCLLIEVKIKVGICAQIINACGGLIDGLYLGVLIKLCLKAGIAL